MQSSVRPEQTENAEDLPSKPRFSWLRYVVITVVSLLLASPVAYLLVRRAMGYPGRVVHDPRPQPVTIAQLEATLTAHPSKANLITLSALYLDNHQPGLAISLLRSLLADHKDSADAWNNLCVAYNQSMRYNLAVEACTHALRIKPAYQLASNNLRFAESRMQGDRKIVTDRDQSSRTANFYISEGMNFLHAGHYHKALSAWQHVLALDPRNAIAANDIGVAYMFLHQPARAIPWFRRAISFDPEMQLARNNLAWGRQSLSHASENSQQ